MCLPSPTQELGFGDVEIDGVFLEGADGESDGDDGRNHDNADADTEFRRRDGTEAVTKHQSDRRGEGEISKELHNETRLGCHER